VTKLRLAAITAALAAALAGCAGGSPHAPDASEGLRHQGIPGPGALYVRPDMSFTPYRTVMVDALIVTVDPRWTPTRDIVTGAVVGPHPVSERELRHVESVLGSEFQRIVAGQLAADGYRVVTKAGDDTLLVSPALVNVYPVAPQESTARDPDAGSMTLVLDLSDAGTRLPLAKFVEEKRGSLGALEIPLSMAEDAGYREAVEQWAKRLDMILDRMSRIREPR
jgi:hypothetical protein